MKIERKWLWLGGALAGGGVALALGVPLATLLVVGALLACPLMMLFGMRGMHRGGSSMASHSGPQDVTRRDEGATVPSSEASRPDEPARRS